MIGRVYKIIHLDSSLCYIGSTCDTLPGRWRVHKNTYKAWTSDKDKYSTVSLYPYLEQYGVERFKMLLIQEYQVADKNQLRAFEQLAINRTKSCCNRQAALQLVGTSSMAKHYTQLVSEHKRLYQQANKQVISEQKKEYYRANKDAINNRSKDYYDANKEELNQKASTKITCECGSIVCKSALTKHRRSAKHTRLLAALNASQ